jgi:diadenosine tetraphosphatase ApaH/serine/threonine PP2A family protein phosphatase
MKVALLADVHANLEALSACLTHAEAQDIERWVFLGDIVGYCADPTAVLDIVMAYAATGAHVVMGNHDAAAILRGTEDMNENAARAIAWTREQLNDHHRAFLAQLPLTVREGEMLFVHASAAAPDRWIYVSDPMRVAHSMNAADVTYVFGGHVHEPVLYYASAQGRPQPFRPVPGVPIPVPAHRRWLAVVGSCGQPRDGTARACYAILDTARRELTYHRLPYDHLSAARKIRAAGLPEKLALRIETGD